MVCNISSNGGTAYYSLISLVLITLMEQVFKSHLTRLLKMDPLLKSEPQQSPSNNYTGCQSMDNPSGRFKLQRFNRSDHFTGKNVDPKIQVFFQNTLV